MLILRIAHAICRPAPAATGASLTAAGSCGLTLVGVPGPPIGVVAERPGGRHCWPHTAR